MDASRRENDAEHSWHMALAAVVLQEYSGCKQLDLSKVVQMCLIHDVVEIDAGDTFIYGNVSSENKTEKERMAAQRIFALLPEEQAREFLALWNEYEEGETPEAGFAQALDSFMPILHNYRTKGLQWQKLKVKSDMVLSRNSRIGKGSIILWEYIRSIVEDAVNKGYLEK